MQLACTTFNPHYGSVLCVLHSEFLSGLLRILSIHTRRSIQPTILLTMEKFMAYVVAIPAVTCSKPLSRRVLRLALVGGTGLLAA